GWVEAKETDAQAARRWKRPPSE
ncbi:molybdopterin synthase catalytic subunit, partial [Mesorhizobium sp. M2D.F.Ca.ET.160.01.1.1]